VKKRKIFFKKYKKISNYLLQKAKECGIIHWYEKFDCYLGGELFA
jgi:hypothetical protein